MITEATIRKLVNVSQEDSNLLSIRYSNKAKRLIFRPSIRTGFEIVVPRVHADKWLIEAIHSNKPKIHQQIMEIKQAQTELRPISIALPSTGKAWKVVYKEHGDSYLDTIRETSATLYVPQKKNDIFSVPEILQQWLHEKALEYLPKHLDSVSIKLKLSYNSVKIKHQRTRWGSCSVKRNINLNRNLMLMPFEVVDYVLHHELAHLRTLNHSPKFWKELHHVYPNYKQSLLRLKRWEINKIPTWAIVSSKPERKRQP